MLTIKSSERRQPFSSVSIADFEQLNVCWVAYIALFLFTTY